MRAFKKLWPLGALWILTGCQTMTPIAVTDTACLAFSPLTYSRRDTARTILEIRRHNAAWHAICPSKPLTYP